jgi:5-(carboxyamino)imidazole ribonucleotide mutase
MDSLLSIVQMPPGVPVATVGINGGKNAALLAVSIIALPNKGISEKLKDYRKEMEMNSMAKNEKLSYKNN